MNQDSIDLLGKCTAGIDMAVSTMGSMLPVIQDRELRRTLRESIRTHQQLRTQTLDLLQHYGKSERKSPAVTRGMTLLKNNAKMFLGGDDTIAADLVIGGCDAGVRALCRSRNRLTDAEPAARAIAQQLIDCEEKLSASLRPYL